MLQVARQCVPHTDRWDQEIGSTLDPPVSLCVCVRILSYTYYTLLLMRKENKKWYLILQTITEGLI